MVTTIGWSEPRSWPAMAINRQKSMIRGACICLAAEGWKESKQESDLALALEKKELRRAGLFAFAGRAISSSEVTCGVLCRTKLMDSA
jgi:hypothetical protein